MHPASGMLSFCMIEWISRVKGVSTRWFGVNILFILRRSLEESVSEFFLGGREGPKASKVSEEKM
jgi:hypothetical protein